MNKSEREELKRLAEAATPGKWSTDICQIDKSWLKGRLQNCVVNPSGVVAIVSESDPDAAFIAAANPAAIQSLLAYVGRLEAQRDRLLEACKSGLDVVTESANVFGPCDHDVGICVCGENRVAFDMSKAITEAESEQ